MESHDSKLILERIIYLFFNLVVPEDVDMQLNRKLKSETNILF
jgi:hypothetical protein